MCAYANRDGQYKQSCSISGVEGYKLNGLRNLAAAKGRGAARMTVASEYMREQWRQIRDQRAFKTGWSTDRQKSKREISKLV